MRWVVVHAGSFDLHTEAVAFLGLRGCEVISITAWRTSEWRQDCWLFTGSVHEPRSSVALCRTEACDTVVSPANIFCPFLQGEAETVAAARRGVRAGLRAGA